MNNVTSEQVTIEMLNDQLDAARAAILVAETDAQVDVAVTERKRLVKSIADMKQSVEKEERDLLLPRIVESLGTFEMPESIIVSGTIRRDESGVFADIDVKLSTTDNAALQDAIADALHDVNEDLEGLESVKGITVVIDALGDGTTAEYTGAKSASSGTKGAAGGGGKGWIKDGSTEVYKLAAIWEDHATADERADYDANKGNGTKQYAVRKAVAKAAGYTLNA